jgi:LysR family transcriptional regulator, benzoate and cis,cis-muconate-responsive activator of ben and cat genes
LRASGQAHLGFLFDRGFSASDELESLSILTSDMMVTVGARHRLAAAKNVRMADLAGETWVITGQQEAPGLREFITQICRLSGFNPSFTRPTQTIEGVLARVATGYGVCLLPEFFVASLPANSLVRCLRSDCPPFELRATWHRLEESRLLKQFLEVLRHHVGADAKPRLTLAQRASKKVARASKARPTTAVAQTTPA